MVKVFFSYKRDDRRHAALVGTILAKLKTQFEVFVDAESLRGGENWMRALDDAVADCDVGVVVWSSEAYDSDYVLGEAERLKKQNKYLGIDLDESRRPMHFDSIVYYSLTGWDGDTTHTEWRKLVTEVHQRPRINSEYRVRAKTFDGVSDILVGTPESASFRNALRPVLFRDAIDLPLLAILPTPGDYMMGGDSSDAAPCELPPQRIYLERPFALGVRPVSTADWNYACNSGAVGCSPRDGAGDTPVVRVSWREAKSYLSWLNNRVDSDVYRLPTEAEWEYGARCGQSGSVRTNADLERRAPISGPTGCNAWALEGMIGNVWQWAADCFSESLEGAPTDGSARELRSSMFRSARGGSYLSPPFERHVFTRTGFDRAHKEADLGFRVARRLGPA